MRIRLAIPTMAFLLAGALWAPPAGAQDTDLPVLDKAERARVIEVSAAYAESNYVFADRAPRIARAIRSRAKRGAYDDAATGEELARRLTADMQEAVPDAHLKVLFSSRARPMPSETGEPGPEEIERRRLEATRRNFGIERAEQWDGNVGYLKLTHFEDPALSGETLAAAMRFISNTDACVIDLRFNGGGNGEAVALLTSWFYDGETRHLADLYDRRTGETNQSWTFPYVPGPRYVNKPLYVLTGERTFSAAEGFTYYLQKSERAVVVGQPTRGGAHFVDIHQIDEHFAVMVPIGNVTCPLTGGNWEGVGITPDVAASSETAVRTAHRLALEKLLETADEGPYAEYLRTLIGEMRDEASGSGS